MSESAKKEEIENKINKMVDKKKSDKEKSKS